MKASTGSIIAALLALSSSLPVQATGVSGQGTWETTLQARNLEGNPNGPADAYYDTALNITWLADVKAAAYSAYDTYIPGSGLMDWGAAYNWTTTLNISGISGWRLPNASPINGTAYNEGITYNGTTDQAYNISAPGTPYAGSTASELAYLFYNTLGNKANYDPSGIGPINGSGLTNTGPFSNLTSYIYDSGSRDPAVLTGAFSLDFSSGMQNDTGLSFKTIPWAVHGGDVGAAVASTAVPVPASIYLLGGGLLGLFYLSTRKQGGVKVSPA